MRPKREITAVVEGIMLALWGKGLDTYGIAKHLGLPESEVYNRILHLREKTR